MGLFLTYRVPSCFKSFIACFTANLITKYNTITGTIEIIGNRKIANIEAFINHYPPLLVILNIITYIQ